VHHDPPADRTIPALHAREVTKRYGEVTALEGASLLVEKGTSVALVGESGSGKTTLLRCFNRMIDPDDGRVEVGGSDVSTRDPVGLRRALGYVQQDGGLLPHWTVLRNTALVPWLEGRLDASERARAQLELVGLPADEFGERYPRELSGGQRQRAALARALASGPEVLLLDEPFGALDALTRADVQDAFGELRRRLGLTVLLVTHDLDEAFRLADRVAVMRAGRIEQVDTPDNLLRNPGTPYVTELLARARLT
jgi:osmoprotectant transport system ATP-binding protein